MKTVCEQWLVEPAEDVTLDVYRSLAMKFALRVKHEPTRLALTDALVHHSYKELCELELDYSGVKLDVLDLINARQVLGFFTKLEGLELGVDKEAAAFKIFQESEDACREANRRFRGLNNDWSGCYAAWLEGHPRSFQLLQIILSAREKIAEILGPVPALHELRARFGGGATTSVKKKDACAREKMRTAPSCGKRLFHSGLLESCLRESPHWTGEHITSIEVQLPDGSSDAYPVWSCNVEVHDAKLAFVPKNWKAHRGTVTEPTLNGYWQLAHGDFMTRRLRQYGIDLKDQSINQRWARQGSIDGSIATIDLRSASDQISRELVKALLPRSWYARLDALRSDTVAYNGELINLEKFSSMGNGYTFPLESLIFWALTWAVKPSGVVSVYGDDIICESSVYDSVVAVLEACGFSVNLEKSYATGYFRESCGKDFFLGVDTRPVFTKHGASLKSMYQLHNAFLERWDPEAADAVLAYLPESSRLWGPPRFGDGHLHDVTNSQGDWRKPVAPGAAAVGFCGYTFKSIRVKPRYAYAGHPGDYVTPLYHVYMSGENQIESDEDTVYRDAYWAWLVKYRSRSGFLRGAVKRLALRMAKTETTPEVKKTKAGWPKWPLPSADTYDDDGNNVPMVGEEVKIYDISG